ncbi:peptidylprolyl isomerase [Oceanivirga miroungae]|uniref:peptidylprolyl isomerase n=1 Tax=Oceanivirga miroungae TaxID=1130046 RepID=A0A6I8MD18_9FUSO|nr:peptidylprolyl isomerase [Oceanivirga miroungae]VWL85392.1 PpiC-type peptidyl-prolyl cis-trans isomerase [Oceanivirga miroungae]
MALRKFSKYMKVVTVIVIFAFAFSAIYAGYSYLINYIQNKRVVLVEIDGSPIYEDEYKNSLANIKEQLNRFGGIKDIPENVYDEVAMSTLLDEALNNELATNLKVRVSSSDINEEVSKLEDRVGGRDTLAVLLAKNGSNLTLLKEQIKKQLLFTNTREKLKESIKVTDEDLMNIYKEYKYSALDGNDFNTSKEKLKEIYYNLTLNLLYHSNVIEILVNSKVTGENKKIVDIVNALKNKEVNYENVYITRKDMLNMYFNQFLINASFSKDLEEKAKENQINEIKKLIEISKKAESKSVKKLAGLNAYDELVYLKDMYTAALINEFKASEKEMKKWFEEHKYEYDTQNTVSGNVLGIKYTPSEKDDTKAKEKIEEIQKELTVENFYELAKKYSMDPGSAVNGGDLGWEDVRNYVPEFHSLLQSETNKIVGPIKTQFGYHLVLVVAKDPIDKERIHLKHILIRPEVSDETKKEVDNRLEAILKELKENKVDFKKLVENKDGKYPKFDINTSFNDELEHSHAAIIGEKHEIMEKIFEMKVNDYIFEKTEDEAILIQKTKEVLYKKATYEDSKERIEVEMAYDYAINEIEK